MKRLLVNRLAPFFFIIMLLLVFLGMMGAQYLFGVLEIPDSPSLDDAAYLKYIIRAVGVSFITIVPWVIVFYFYINPILKKSEKKNNGSMDS